MKMDMLTKVSIGVIIVTILGFIGFQVWLHQETQEPEVKPSTKQQTTRAVSQSTSHKRPSVSKSDIQDEQKQGIEEAPARLDSMGSGGKTEDGQQEVAPKTEVSEVNQDSPETEYHESYDTFITVTNNIEQIKSEMTTMDEELERLVAEWKQSVRDPKNPTEEEKRLAIEMKTNPMWEERQELESDLNSLANELVSEIEAVAPGAIQTESRETPKGTMNTVTIDYEHIQSALGSPPEEDDADLAEFFAGFEMNSMPTFGWSEVNIKKNRCRHRGTTLQAATGVEARLCPAKLRYAWMRC